MADQSLSWRRQPASGGGGSQAITSVDDAAFRSAESWRSRGATPGHHSHRLTSPTKADSRIHTRNSAPHGDAGPAAPLYPLHVGKALPHPTTYAGVGNWALTPTDSLPSLPATPSRAMQSMGWNHFALPKDEGSGSRELSAARALLNRRNEDIVASPGGLVTRLSPKGISRPLATGSPSFPASTVRSPPPSNYTGHSDSPKPECNTQFSSPSLRHRDSTNSVASSSLLSIGHYGHHALSHSRRGSQVFVNSPASSTNTSSNATGPGYRVYRPPHLRGPNSVHALKPKVAHYDRVRTPSLRGQSRSPDAAGLSARLHQVGSGTPSEASVPGRLYARTRRLSNLGSFNSSIYDEQTGGKEALDSRALYKKLAASRKVSDASSHIPDGLYNVEDGRSDNYVVEDDVDLSVEDLMHSLTDEYCLSRTGSMSDNRPVVDIFQIGDRLGPGMMHDGLEVTIAETSEGFQSQHADLTGSQLEVVKKLGEGSYAVVYLVKEVPRDAAPDTKRGRRGEERSDGVQIPKAESGERETEDGDDTILGSYDIYSSTLKASSTGQLQSSRTTVEEESQPARHFALKCLCKRDLSDQMLEVQRLEATIHQSIPKHPNIVTLHRTYETAEWLFLILEYCPGQDLFYWLEQANDTTNLGGAETPLGEADASSDSADMTATDATPPSPSILASTESRFLLSARRLRLISRMFKQMCEAVAVCHDRGISHRDIKPENFIVEDTREGSRSDSVQVKLTDFGLAVAQRQCIDFDCGSKPYMAEECRNNRTKWYDPQQSDIWSLGIVLLNLIFHRNPFSEPNVDNCPSFASYVEDPVHFLFTAFRGLKWEAARYLAENVFCDVTEGMDETSGAVRKRISAREFGEWASTLGKYLEAPFTTPQVAGEENFGAVERFTSPVEQSRSVTSSLIHSLQASPLSENAKARYSVLQELTSMGIQEEEWSKYGSLFPKQIADPSSLTHDESVQLTQGRSTEEVERPDEAPLAASDSVDRIEEEAASVNNPEFTQTERPSMTVNTALDKGEAEPVLLVSPHSASTETSTAKRRGKRGARKGRTMTKKELRRSLSVENFTSQGNRGAEQSRDQMLRELAEASQRLAREMSKSASGDSPISDTASTSVSSHATSADVASNASSSFTNFSWQVTSGLNDRIPDRRGLTEEQSSASNLRARAGLPLPPTAGNWRERNASVSSTASSGYFSDVASIYSTASAPAALAARRQQLTSSSSYASSAASQGSYKPSCNRSAVAAASNLDTITEKAPRPAAEKHLDASYLAGIFGGRVPHSNRIISRDKVAAKPTPHRALDGGIKAGALAHVLPPRAPVLPTRSMATPNAVRAEALGRSSTGAESSNGPLSS